MYSFILHLHMRLLKAFIWEPSESRAIHLPYRWWALWSRQGQRLGLVWASEGPGVVGESCGGVTECLGTCHFVSVFESTSGLLWLWPQAKCIELTGLDYGAGNANLTVPPYPRCAFPLPWCRSLHWVISSDLRPHRFNTQLKICRTVKLYAQDYDFFIS